MKIFLDLEMTAITHEIISIGAVDERNNIFYSLVRPSKVKHVTAFITKLTGITREELYQERPFNEVLDDFLQWCILIQGDEKKDPSFIVYGENDKATLSMYTNTEFICDNIIDFSIIVKRHFLVKNSVALKALFIMLHSEENFEQTHNALDDAIMLKEVFDNLKNIEYQQNVKDKVAEEKRLMKEKFPSSKLKEQRPANAFIYATNSFGATTKLRNIQKATNWAISCFVHKTASPDMITEKIVSAIETGSKYCGCTWTVLDEEYKEQILRKQGGK